MFTSSTLSMSSVDSLSCSRVRMSAHGALYSAYASSFPSLECLHTSTLTGSEELRQFLLSKGIATSRTTPACNGQVEKYNGTVWKAMTMALKTRGLPVTRWQDVLPDALHSLRSLLCTATNCTSHERFFKFERRSSCGGPTWLSSPGPVLLKRHVRTSRQSRAASGKSTVCSYSTP